MIVRRTWCTGEMIPQNRAVIRQMEISQQASLSLPQLSALGATYKPWLCKACLPWHAMGIILFISYSKSEEHISTQRPTWTQESFWWNKSKENYFQYVSILILLMSWFFVLNHTSAVKIGWSQAGVWIGGWVVGLVGLDGYIGKDSKGPHYLSGCA